MQDQSSPCNMAMHQRRATCGIFVNEL